MPQYTFVSYVFGYVDDDKRYYDSQVLNINKIKSTSDIRKLESQITNDINNSLRLNRVDWVTILNILPIDR